VLVTLIVIVCRFVAPAILSAPSLRWVHAATVFGVAAVVAVSGAESDVVGDALPAIQSNLMDFDIHQKSHLAARELRSNISS
jgi:hypothetical protein